MASTAGPQLLFEYGSPATSCDLKGTDSGRIEDPCGRLSGNWKTWSLDVGSVAPTVWKSTEKSTITARKAIPAFIRFTRARGQSVRRA